MLETFDRGRVQRRGVEQVAGNEYAVSGGARLVIFRAASGSRGPSSFSTGLLAKGTIEERIGALHAAQVPTTIASEPHESVVLELMRFWTSLGVLFLSLLTDATVRADGPFHFKPPVGWENVSGDIGGSLSKLVQPDFAEQIRKANFAIYAFDPAAGPGENMNATVRNGTLSITDSVVTQLAAGLSDTVSKMIGAKAEVTEAVTFELHGATCGRVMYNFSLNGMSQRGAAYLLPSATQLATVTFTAPKDVFERHLSLYEASVAATEGIAQPASGLPSWMYGVIGAGAAAAATAAARQRKARDEKKAA